MDDRARFAEVFQLTNTIQTLFPYRMPKLFPKWSFLAGVIASGVFPASDDEKKNEATSIMFRHWIANQYPIHCISKDLVRAFEAVDLDSLAPIIGSDDWVPSHDFIMVFFPENVFRLDASNNFIYLAIITFYEFDGQRSIRYLSVENSGRIDGAVGQLTPATVAKIQLSGADSRARKLALMMFQIALSLETELLEPTETADPNPHKKRHQKRSKKELELHPRWIGKTYTRPTGSSKGGSHASPRTHWRAGYTRKQACGKGWKNHKIIRIAPTIVNG